MNECLGGGYSTAFWNPKDKLNIISGCVCVRLCVSCLAWLIFQTILPFFFCCLHCAQLQGACFQAFVMSHAEETQLEGICQRSAAAFLAVRWHKTNLSAIKRNDCVDLKKECRILPPDSGFIISMVVVFCCCCCCWCSIFVSEVIWLFYLEPAPVLHTYQIGLLVLQW